MSRTARQCGEAPPRGVDDASVGARALGKSLQVAWKGTVQQLARHGRDLVLDRGRGGAAPHAQAVFDMPAGPVERGVAGHAAGTTKATVQI